MDIFIAFIVGAALASWATRKAIKSPTYFSERLARIVAKIQGKA